jgi:hypothetical protein
MSKRHRSQETAPPPRVELRAHAHNERHRMHSELHTVAGLVSNGIEPGQAWRVEAHHDKERALRKMGRAPKRHWKTKDWKRRNVLRRQRALAFRRLAD